MIGWKRHSSAPLGKSKVKSQKSKVIIILDFGLKVFTKRLLSKSKRILFITIRYHAKLPKLVLFGVK